MKSTIGLVLTLVLSSFMAFGQTKIIAHRGFSAIAPENTLIAFQKAIDIGAEYFELDIHLSKDDSLMVIHDNTIDRTGSNDMVGTVVEMNYDELTKARVGLSSKFGDTFKDEKIPTLREALMLAKGKIKVSIEIKVYGAEQAVVNLVNELDMINEVIVFSFYYPVLAKIRELDKNIPTLFLISTANDLTISYAQAIAANAIGVGGGTLVDSAFMEEAHKQNMEVWRWTVDNEDEMKQLISVGLDGLITNKPDKALKLRK